MTALRCGSRGSTRNSDSYRDGFSFERIGVNPTAAFAIGEATVVRLSYEFYDYDRTADRGLPSELGRPYKTAPSTFFGDPERSDTYATVNQGALVIDHAFNDNVQLRNRTQYADYDKFYQNIYAGGPVDAVTRLVPLSAYNNEQLRENVFNQTDLSFSFETGAIGHEFLTGVELGEQLTDNFRNTGFLQRHGPAVPRYRRASRRSPCQVSSGRSLTDCGQATAARPSPRSMRRTRSSFSSKWLAVLGLRYDNFRHELHQQPHRRELSGPSDDLVSPRAGPRLQARGRRVQSMRATARPTSRGAARSSPRST
jgi:catecholate siderophore receptor